MSRPLIALVVLAALLAGAAGCARPASPTDADHVGVAGVTVAPHAWLVERIAGDLVDVRVALSGIASCHDHAPPESAVVGLAGADVYLTAGIGAENGGWLDTVIADDTMIVADLLAAAAAPLDADAAASIGPDPHAWTCPAALRRQTIATRDALVRRWPAHAETFTERAAALDAELAELESSVAELLGPLAGTLIVVDHAAWTWLAADHDIEQIVVIPEPGAVSDRSLEDIRQLMIDASVPTILIQPQHDSRASRTLADAVGADLISLDPMSGDPLTAIRDAADAIARVARPMPSLVAAPTS